MVTVEGFGMLMAQVECWVLPDVMSQILALVTYSSSSSSSYYNSLASSSSPLS